MRARCRWAVVLPGPAAERALRALDALVRRARAGHAAPASASRPRPSSHRGGRLQGAGPRTAPGDGGRGLAVRHEGRGVARGHTVTLAKRVIVCLDVTGNVGGRATLLDTVRRTAERVFVPLTVGGGIASVEDAARALRAGADKVAVNSAAVTRPALLTELSGRFGAQCVVASIDARRSGERWDVFTRAGTTPTGLDAIAWARECVDRGAGEIVLTSIDRDGTRAGYDVDLTRAVADAV